MPARSSVSWSGTRAEAIVAGMKSWLSCHAMAVAVIEVSWLLAMSWRTSRARSAAWSSRRSVTRSPRTLPVASPPVCLPVRKPEASEW
ncbi:Uncharacterised protein [Mycobacteroides abscessus subsp. abscessus]|nr:Uncharacterised protein [Mycobacteroides abscessus subsp. abscessus]